MSFFKRLFSKKKKKTQEQISQPIPRSGKGGHTVIAREKRGKFLKKPSWIRNISAPSTIKKGEVLEILVSGHFTDLGYKLDEGYAHIHDNDIVVTVIGMKETGMMAGQALKPYSTTIEVKNLEKGKYTIMCDKGNAKEVQIKVQ